MKPSQSPNNRNLASIPSALRFSQRPAWNVECGMTSSSQCLSDGPRKSSDSSIHISPSVTGLLLQVRTCTVVLSSTKYCTYPRKSCKGSTTYYPLLSLVPGRRARTRANRSPDLMADQKLRTTRHLVAGLETSIQGGRSGPARAREGQSGKIQWQTRKKKQGQPPTNRSRY